MNMLCYIMIIRKTQTRWATILSRVFDPPVLFLVVTSIGIGKSGILNNPLVFVLLFLFIVFGLPFIFFLFLFRKHYIQTIDVPNRKERIFPILGLLLFFVFDIVIVSIFNNVFLFQLFSTYALWLIGFLSITMVWKISGHTSVAVFSLGLLTRWFGSVIFIGWVFVPLIAWARVIRRDHTIPQVVSGIVYSLFILAISSVWLYER